MGQRIGDIQDHPINLKLHGFGSKSDPVMTLFRTEGFKLTIKTGLNAKITSSVVCTELQGRDVNSEAYLSMGKYDIRGKFYLNQRFRIILRYVNLATMVGVPSKGYGYLIGVTYKF